MELTEMTEPTTRPDEATHDRHLWEGWRRDAGCDCTAPGPTDCGRYCTPSPKETRECPCHYLSRRGDPVMTDATTTPPLTPRQDAAVRPLETPTGADADTETPEGATGPQAGAQGRARMTADTATDDGLDWLYAELARARADAANLFAANGALRDACARWRAERDAERADLAEARDERDRARRVAVELENELAAVAALHQPTSDWSWRSFGCAHGGEHAVPCRACRTCHPCATARALNHQEDQ